jgi:hypothetical protein
VDGPPTDPAPRPLPLFPAGELCLAPTGTARLRELARLAPRTASRRERRQDEDRRVVRQLRSWGGVLADDFGLHCTRLEAEHEGVTAHYGICYEDGTIRIRLRHARTGNLLKESSLVDTLCHELAHLRHMDHGPRFRRLYQRILDRARLLGFYRPGPGGPPAPRQGELFAGCGAAAGRAG